MLTPMADDADATLAVRSTTAGDVTTTLSVYDTICRSLGWGAPGWLSQIFPEILSEIRGGL